MNPGPSPWSAVIFDLDGTLVNSIDLIVASFQHAFAEVAGLEVSRAEALAWIGQPLRGVLQDRDPARADALFASYQAHNRAHAAAMIRPFPGVLELVEGLRSSDVAVAVATSKGRESATLALSLVGLDSEISILVALEDSARHKPFADPLLVAVDRVGASVERSCYVGDARVDVAAAKAAGMASVAVTYGAGTPEELVGADHLVDSVGDLTGLLLTAS